MAYEITTHCVCVVLQVLKGLIEFRQNCKDRCNTRDQTNLLRFCFHSRYNLVKGLLCAFMAQTRKTLPLL